ncbi:MAG: hypothetical protein EBS84_03340 [Proteobacteria bacterium]|nr:hypothetical protein [Verrucomicrobiota bacterium]NBU08045.1 hypothetical protein [Pseudomonadota bacterium]
MNPWKFILATVLIYGTGVVTGALVIKLVDRPQPAHVKASPQLTFNQIQRAEFLSRLQKQLNLTPEQNEHIGQILRDSNQRTKPYWDPVAAKMKDEVRTVTDKIRAELSPEQIAKFEIEIKSGRTPKKDPERKEKKVGGTNAPAGKPHPKMPAATNSIPITNAVPATNVPAAPATALNKP